MYCIDGAWNGGDTFGKSPLQKYGDSFVLLATRVWTDAGQGSPVYLNDVR